ncbi:transposase family protein, partial [Streptomyces nigra]
VAATHGNGEPGRLQPPVAAHRTHSVPQSAATREAFLRENTMVRDMAERILGNAVMYVMGSIENPDVHLGVGKLVDIGVHQLILDTPVWWGLCHRCNGGMVTPHRKCPRRELLPGEEEDNAAHRKVRARVEHVIGRMKNYQVLRDCRQHGDGLRHAVQAVAHMHNLALAS